MEMPGYSRWIALNWNSRVTTSLAAVMLVTFLRANETTRFQAFGDIEFFRREAKSFEVLFAGWTYNVQFQ